MSPADTAMAVLALTLAVGCVAFIVIPSSWFDDRALTRPMELPDEAMLEALREVEEIAPDPFEPIDLPLPTHEQLGLRSPRRLPTPGPGRSRLG